MKIFLCITVYVSIYDIYFLVFIGSNRIYTIHNLESRLLSYIVSRTFKVYVCVLQTGLTIIEGKKSQTNLGFLYVFCFLFSCILSWVYFCLIDVSLCLTIGSCHVLEKSTIMSSVTQLKLMGFGRIRLRA